MEVISAGGGSRTEEQRFAISSAEALTNLCEVKCVEAEEKRCHSNLVCWFTLCYWLRQP